jgi:hypothetical protein
MVRLTALTAVFFVLLLIAGSPNSGKAAAWFGALVDLGIVFTATRESMFSTLADVVQGVPTGADQATLTAAIKVTEPPPDIVLPESDGTQLV